MFVILAFQRSGTHLLGSLLNSHPDLRCYDEIFLDPRRSRKRPLGRKDLWEMQDHDGCIVMYSQLIKRSLEERMAIRRSKIIHLARNDFEKHSQSIFKKAGIEFSEKKSRRLKRRIARQRAQALNHPFEEFYSITYEEICRNKNIREYENKELLKFLGVKPMKLTTSLRKGFF